MSLLPAAAQPYVAAPLQALMAPDHPLAEVYHATPPPVWRAELASRIRLAVEAVPAEAYSAEEREAIATGRVRAFGLVRESAHLAASVAHLAGGRPLAPLRAPPPPPVGGAPLRNAERVGVASAPPALTANEEAHGLLRWRWGDLAPPPAAPPAVEAAPVATRAQAVPPPAAALPAAVEKGRHLLALLQQPAPAPQPAAPPAAPAPHKDAGAALLALLQPQAQPQAPSPPPAPPGSVLPIPSGLLSRHAPGMAPGMAPSMAPTSLAPSTAPGVVTTAAQLELEQLLDLLRPPASMPSSLYE